MCEFSRFHMFQGNGPKLVVSMNWGSFLRLSSEEPYSFGSI